MRTKMILLALVCYAAPAFAGNPPYTRGPISNTYNQLGTSLYYQQMSRTSGRTTVADKPFEGSRLGPDQTLRAQQIRTANEVRKLNGPSTLPADYLSRPISQDAFRKLGMGQKGALAQKVATAYQAWKFANDRGLGAPSDASATLRAYGYLLSLPQSMYFDKHSR